MNLSEMIEVECPSCRNKESVEYFGIINVQENPSLKDKLYDGQLNQFHCSNCGYDAFLDGSLIYQDLERNMMLQVTNAQNDEDLKNELEYLNGSNEILENTFSVKMEKISFRIVSDKNSLIEKINIFDNSLDDRIIEMLKVFIYQEFLKQYNDATVEILFLGIGNEGLDFLVFVGEEKLQTTLQMEMYHEIKEKFSSSLSDFETTKGSWCFVDQNTVLELLEN
ncbi:MAG: CpXC domain-containing protein [Leptospiraceae bacterium]|nr:CpXC domain-containing protein [Leptospiraceae bacterium]